MWYLPLRNNEPRWNIINKFKPLMSQERDEIKKNIYTEWKVITIASSEPRTWQIQMFLEIQVT